MHGARQLVIPETVSLVPLPSYAPEWNPVERLWLHLREHFFSHRAFDGYDEIVAACCTAWNSLTAEQPHPSAATLDHKCQIIGSAV